jgi:hypothetical protein
MTFCLFSRNQRRNSNIDQLVFLEHRKAKARFEKTEIHNNQIIRIGHFIHLIDGIWNDGLTAASVAAWQLADESMSQSDSAVFELEFGCNPEGGVLFAREVSLLMETISGGLAQSLVFLQSLPRILCAGSLSRL